MSKMEKYFNIEDLINTINPKIYGDTKKCSIYLLNKNFNIKENFEDTLNKKRVIQVSIYKNKKFPFFFIQDNMDNENFRLSANFNYLNKNWGIKINIIREVELINNFMKLLITRSEKFNIINIYQNQIDNSKINILKVYLKTKENEKVFLVQKSFNNINYGVSLIFFGDNFHSFQELFYNIKNSIKG